MRLIHPVRVVTLAALLLASVVPKLPAAVSVLTYQYDNTRAGANTNETILTPANVNTNSFGKLFQYPVDGYVYGQPLIMTNVTIPGKGTHNVMYIVTEHDTVYAFDADTYVSTPYWTNSFINLPNTNTLTSGFGSGVDVYGNIMPELGITGTPVIDPVAGTIFMEARTKVISAGPVTNFYHMLHALDITTGQERPNSPVNIYATNYPGTGGSNGVINGVTVHDSDGAGHVLWNSLQEQNRPGLLLLNGQIFIAYAQPGDKVPWHGWLFGYNETNLTQTGVFCITPNGEAGGMWMGGGAPAADTNGFIYVNTGNGDFNAGASNYGDAYVKFSTTNGIQVADYFSPNNTAFLESHDLDISSAGMILLPDSVGSPAHQHLLFGGSKNDAMFLLDQTNLGQFNAASDQIVQGITNSTSTQLFSGPAYFNGSIYNVAEGQGVKAYSIANASINTTATSTSAATFASGTTPTISANGTSNGIVWALNIDAFNGSGAAVLHALNATNLGQELYNSSLLARDNPGPAVHFTSPSVANGKVYVPAHLQVSVFGNSTFLQAPVISPNGGVFTNSQTVTLSNSLSGTTIYYTLDGTTPTTNSTLYSGPFAITQTTLVQAMATYPGAVNSPVASASFQNSLSLPPSPWQTADIGSVAFTGSVYFSNGVFVVRGSGTDIYSTSDAFRFVYQTSTGDCTNIAHVTGIQNVNVYSKAGIMIRNDLTPSSANVMVLMTAAQGASFQYRTNSGNATTSSFTASLTAPYWVKMVRIGNTFTGYRSPDGVTWTQQGTITFPMASTAYVGLAVTSHDNTQITTGTFDHVTVNNVTYTNPPPAVALTGPATNSTYTATASVNMSANAAALYDTITGVNFYANSTFVGSVSNQPYTLTATGLGAGSYALTAVAVSSSGLFGTSAPVNITVNAGTGLPYGLTSRAATPAFFNMPMVIPATLPGSLPTNLSQTGVFANTASMTPASGLIPYSPNTPLWSDAALKTRWMAVPYSGAPETPAQQITFAPTGEWLFPNGTVFVKHFALTVNETNTNVPPRRLETRLLVRDQNGAVYGVTYKWRPDNSDADLLTTSLSEDITITNASGTRIQTWYYPSPTDCLLCHTPAASYVLGVKTRQLNGNFTYPSSGVTDNQLRTLNQLGMLNPAFNETAISGYSQLVSVTNLSADVTNRFRSYIDANCAQCHRPGGTGGEAEFDARYDTALASQNIVNGTVVGNLGFDNAHVVTPDDIWRSILFDRADSVAPSVKMPPLARNLIDTNAMAVVAAFINSLPGTPALAPPTMSPTGGSFNASASVSLTPPDMNAAMYYTLDGSLPTTNSTRYTGPVVVTNPVVTLNANAFETGFNNSVATNNLFIIYPDSLNGSISNGVFYLPFSGVPGLTYILEASTNLTQGQGWVPISTNTPGSSPFTLTDPNAANFPQRFYRAVQSQ